MYRSMTQAPFQDINHDILNKSSAFAQSILRHPAPNGWQRERRRVIVGRRGALGFGKDDV
jgi:hypothetical protein